MKFRILISLWLVSLFSSVFAQYNDPNIPKPVSGYGADGTHTVGVISFVNPNFTSKNIEIYYPSDIQTPVPTIFYSHAYGGNISDNISGMLNFVAMKGYAIVFVPYQTLGVTVEDRYANLLNGFRMAARNYPAVIDTTRVGFMGHSFGGGASFGLAHQCFTENNWGSNGRFIYALAQWYSYQLDDHALSSFPADTKVLVEVFDDDTTNDHRMAIDVFNHINISAAEKDYILLKSDTINGYVYSAEHNVPSTSVAFDAYDYYAYYRFIDALADYAFHGSAAGKLTALGNGSVEQVTMPGGLKPLVQTDTPFTSYPESKYTFPCSSSDNPRSDQCVGTTEINDVVAVHQEPLIYPNPVTNAFRLKQNENTSGAKIGIYSVSGEKLMELDSRGSDKEINVSFLPAGIYVLKAGQTYTRMLKL